MQVLLGVTGCIGAYKAPELVRLLQREGLTVQVILTRSGAWFVTEGTLQTLSGRPVYTDLFAPKTAAGVEHIDVARQSELLLVAPATAHTIGRFAGGLADDFLSTVYLAFRGPVLVAPAMNTAMFQHPAVQKNLQILKDRGTGIIGPGEGELACGEEGEGRLMDLPVIVRAVMERLQPPRLTADLHGRLVLVSSGPTCEPIDPVRFLSNPSSGRMGHALARAARSRGARVVLVSGPTALPRPPGVEQIDVLTAEEMRTALLAHADDADLVLMAAAVGDYKTPETAATKLKKETGRDRVLRLVPTPDILAELGRRPGRRPVLVGFAAETEDLEKEARRKLETKNLDHIVANRVGVEGSGFASDTNQVLFLTRGEAAERWPLLSKDEVARRILDRVVARHFTARAMPDSLSSLRD